MKKQILFVAMFIVAMIFASTTNVVAQLTCTADALHPTSGILYHYTTTIAGPGYLGTGNYEWFVTTNPDIKAKVKKVVADGLFSAISGEATNDVSITWTPAAIALAKTTPIYVALYYSETNSAGACTAENTRALQIAPVNSFLLAIAPVDASGVALASVCAAPIETAVVDNPADVPGGEDNGDASMKITYGANTLYFNVTASGVIGNWKPSVRLPGLSGSQTYTSADWSSDGGTTWNPIAGVAGNTAGGDFTSATDAPATVAGAVTRVRIVITNNDYETLLDQPILVGVDGTLATDYTIKDIKTAADCTDEIDFGKTATQTILARPTLTPGVPAFMAKTPAN